MMSSPQEPVSIDHKQTIASLKERLENYKLKNQLVNQREIGIEKERAEKEELKKEREEIRLEAEKQALILELQRISTAKPMPAKNVTAATPPAASQPQSLFASFGYPSMVTEKEAIDWLRNGF